MLRVIETGINGSWPTGLSASSIDNARRSRRRPVLIRTEGPNPDTLPNRVACHAQAAAPLVIACFENLLLRCPLAFDRNEHVVRQSKPGALSFGLYLSDGRQFHFRGFKAEAYAVIHVYDRWTQPKREVASLRDPDDVRRFFEALRVASATVAA